jgi:tRNA-2-methylthio-N6-dimethylallyladenosine synthase
MDFNGEEPNIFDGILTSGTGNGSKVYLETYGCQMNVNDSEVVASILLANGFSITQDINQADVILINTCSIRENAETRVFGRIDLFGQVKKSKPSVIIGVLGCMAERLKNELLEKKKIVDLVVGPDAYRDCQHCLGQPKRAKGCKHYAFGRENLCRYKSGKARQAWRVGFCLHNAGCNNMCSYCVVPYTRGTERSRDPQTIYMGRRAG